MKDKEIIYDGRTVSNIGEIRTHKDFELIKDLFDPKYDNIEIKLMNENDLSSEYDAFFVPETRTIYIDENVTPEIIAHEYTHLLDFIKNRFDIFHKIEYYLYNVTGKSVEQLKDDIIESIAIENEEIAKERLNGNTKIKFKRPTFTTATLLRKFIKGEIGIRDIISRIKTYRARRKTTVKGKETVGKNAIKHTYGQTQEGIGLSGVKRAKEKLTPAQKAQ